MNLSISSHLPSRLRYGVEWRTRKWIENGFKNGTIDDPLVTSRLMYVTDDRSERTCRPALAYWLQISAQNESAFEKIIYKNFFFSHTTTTCAHTHVTYVYIVYVYIL